MEVIRKVKDSVSGVPNILNFDDRAIDKLFIKSGPRKDFKFRNIKVLYLKGLILRYYPKTQKKRFYSKIRYKGINFHVDT